MAFDSKKLRALMVEKDLNARKLAKILEIPEPTLYNKLNGKSEFKTSEIKKISAFLEIEKSQIGEYFF